MIFSCKKSNDKPCKYYTLGNGYDRQIPDSVPLGSDAIIGVLWKRELPCQRFNGFFADSIYGYRQISVETLVDKCNCEYDTAKFTWKYYTFRPDTIGRYPIQVSAFLAGNFVDTIVVY